jgi:hypothetical protein
MDRLQNGFRIKSSQHDICRARIDGPAHAVDHPRDMEERQNRKKNVLLQDTIPNGRTYRIGNETEVRNHRSFGKAGGTGSIL